MTVFLISLLSLPSVGILAGQGIPRPGVPIYAASTVCGHDHLTGMPLETPPYLVVHVVDRLGDPIPDARVLVRRGWAEPGVRCNTTTDGRCVFSGLAVQPVMVTAELAGFATGVAKDLSLRKGCTTGITMPLEVADISD